MRLAPARLATLLLASNASSRALAQPRWRLATLGGGVCAAAARAADAGAALEAQQQQVGLRLWCGCCGCCYCQDISSAAAIYSSDSPPAAAGR